MRLEAHLGISGDQSDLCAERLAVPKNQNQIKTAI
jgi:hypothetical protein